MSSASATSTISAPSLGVSGHTARDDPAMVAFIVGRLLAVQPLTARRPGDTAATACKPRPRSRLACVAAGGNCRDDRRPWSRNHPRMTPSRVHFGSPHQTSMAPGGSMRRTSALACLIGLVAAAWSSAGWTQEARHYRFAYDQPRNTGYSIAGDIFADKLKELSKGTMIIDQYPGAQLGQEPQVLQLMKAGDIEFCISSSANAATLSPQAGVMSLHFLFRSEDHLKKALADPKVVQAVKDMVEDTVQGGHVIAVITLGLRNMYSKKEIRKVEDMKGLKVRVQATATEDTMFP